MFFKGGVVLVKMNNYIMNHMDYYNGSFSMFKKEVKKINHWKWCIILLSLISNQYDAWMCNYGLMCPQTVVRQPLSSQVKSNKIHAVKINNCFMNHIDYNRSFAIFQKEVKKVVIANDVLLSCLWCLMSTMHGCVFVSWCFHKISTGNNCHVNSVVTKKETNYTNNPVQNPANEHCSHMFSELLLKQQ